MKAGYGIDTRPITPNRLYVGGDPETRRRLMPRGLEVFPSSPAAPATAPLKHAKHEGASTPTQAPPRAFPPALPLLLQRGQGPKNKKRKRQRPQERRGSLGPWAEMARDPLLAERRRLYERQHAQEMAVVGGAEPGVVPMEEEEEEEREEEAAFAGALPFAHAPTWDDEAALG